MDEEQTKLTWIFQAVAAMLKHMPLAEFNALNNRLGITDHLYENYDYYHYIEQGQAIQEAVARLEGKA
jgi:hypothetical protein